MSGALRNALRGWRTVIINVLALLVMMLDLMVPILGMPEFLAILPDGWGPYFVLGLAIVNVLLRLDTRTGVGRSE